MKVMLLEHTPDPERTVAAAARLCYSADDPDKLLEKLTDEKVGAFLDKLIGLGHLSPLEHVSFTFSVSGVSRACTHQLVRHRIASYSQRSQRYVKEKQFDYVIPPTIQGNAEARAAYEKLMGEIQQAYNAMVEAGIPAEDARYVLPNGCDTSIVVTMNTRSLYNFFQHRCCTRAQWEIRGVANRMLQECKKVAPRLFAKAGATCVTHLECHEGEMSCGLVERLRAQAMKESM